jgi:HlyD family secretion protein
MSMSADIETETRHNVLAVPIQSVTTRVPKVKEGGKPDSLMKDQKEGKVNAEAKGNPENMQEKPVEVVFVVESGKVKQLPVKRGISDETTVEIMSGLSESVEVVSGSYKAINRELEDGTTVKVDNTTKRFGATKKEGTN